MRKLALTAGIVLAMLAALTHTITPTIPVWAGFGPSTFAPT
jgi:hypothetical protein